MKEDWLMGSSAGLRSVQGVEAPTSKSVGMTLIGVAAFMGIAYVCDRIYLRWLHENHPLAEHRARMRRMSTGYQRKRAGLKEVVGIVADVLVGVARATATDAR
jgi:hypothetical protein